MGGDDGEASFPAVPSDALGQVFEHLVPLFVAPEKHLAQLEGILKREDRGHQRPHLGQRATCRPESPRVHLSKRCVCLCVCVLCCVSVCCVVCVLGGRPESPQVHLSKRAVCVLGGGLCWGFQLGGPQNLKGSNYKGNYTQPLFK